MEEDEALCYAWLAISQDPAIGVGKKDTRFWNRIRDHFSEAITGKDSRTLCSIQNRWEKIRKDCSKYRGCLSQIEHRHLTGATLSDKVRFILLLIVSLCSNFLILNLFHIPL
jgi:hypothetical protein